MKKSVIRKNSEVCYKFTNKFGRVEAGVGKVVSIDKKKKTCRVLDTGVFYTIDLKNVVNSRSVFGD